MQKNYWIKDYKEALADFETALRPHLKDKHASCDQFMSDWLTGVRLNQDEDNILMVDGRLLECRDSYAFRPSSAWLERYLVVEIEDNEETFEAEDYDKAIAKVQNNKTLFEMGRSLSEMMGFFRFNDEVARDGVNECIIALRNRLNEDDEKHFMSGVDSVDNNEEI